jgi:hypothetical protein
MLSEFLPFVAVLAITVGLAWLLSLYLQRVFAIVPAALATAPAAGSQTITPPASSSLLAKACYLPRLIETGLYRIAGIDPGREHSWLTYLVGIVLFNLVGLIWLATMLHYQHVLPMNPAQLPAVPWPLAINIAASFVTNTNWQAYAGEVALSHFSQTVGLAVQNFLAPASALTIALALTRSFARSNMTTLGNCWRDMIRAILYVLLPLALLFALILVALGVPQNFDANLVAQGLEGGSQILPQFLMAAVKSCRRDRWPARRPSCCWAATGRFSGRQSGAPLSESQPDQQLVAIGFHAVAAAGGAVAVWAADWPAKTGLDAAAGCADPDAAGLPAGGVVGAGGDGRPRFAVAGWRCDQLVVGGLRGQR